jgi:hypothetical protein
MGGITGLLLGESALALLVRGDRKNRPLFSFSKNCFFLSFCLFSLQILDFFNKFYF